MAAIQLRDELRRSDPAKPVKQIWREVYRALIPAYDTLPLIKRRAEEDRSRQQVRGRAGVRAPYRPPDNEAVAL
jgi:hypothetical protein